MTATMWLLGLFVMPVLVVSLAITLFNFICKPKSKLSNKIDVCSNLLLAVSISTIFVSSPAIVASFMSDEIHSEIANDALNNKLELKPTSKFSRYISTDSNTIALDYFNQYGGNEFIYRYYDRVKIVSKCRKFTFKELIGTVKQHGILKAISSDTTGDSIISTEYIQDTGLLDVKDLADPVCIDGSLYYTISDDSLPMYVLETNSRLEQDNLSTKVILYKKSTIKNNIINDYKVIDIKNIA